MFLSRRVTACIAIVHARNMSLNQGNDDREGEERKADIQRPE